MKKIFNKIMIFMILLSMFSQSFLSGSMTVLANQNLGIKLTGNIAGNTDSILSNKIALLADNEGVTVTYQLSPEYTEAFSSGVRVHLYMPSFNQDGDKFTQVGQSEAPGSKGVKAQIVNIDESWHAPNGTTQEGGWIQLDYLGHLGAGENPSFQVRYDTYGGTLPEGLKLELHGFVTYESYREQDNSAWITDEKRDSNSELTLIATNLEWEASLNVPTGDDSAVDLWDRYHYVDYIYEIENNSSNEDANIDGYHVSLEMDSLGINKNGVLEYDINRWKHNPGGSPIENTNPSDTVGEFVGVRDQGGLLIYDITELNDISDDTKLGDTIPYSYSGGGSINFDRSRGENKQTITPDGSDGPSKRKYLISVPISKLGFPDLPKNFKISAITNVVFSGDTNWSKTTVIEREMITPKYEADFNATSQSDRVIFGGYSYFETNNINNKSNVKIWNPILNYKIDPGYAVDKIEFSLPKGEDFSEYTEEKVLFESLKDLNIDGVFSQDDNKSYLTFDIKHLNDVKEWDRTFNVPLKDSISKKTVLPLSIKLYGQPISLKDVKLSTTLNFQEKFVVNKDVSANTDYNIRSHKVEKETIISIAEIIPSLKLGVNSDSVSSITSGRYTGTVKLGEEIKLNYFFGIDEAIAPNSEFKTILNSKNNIGIKDAVISIDKEYFTLVDSPKLTITYLDETIDEIDLKDHSVEENYEFKTDRDVASVTLTNTNFKASKNQKLLTITGVVSKGKVNIHDYSSSFRIFQDSPYEFNKQVNANGRINISLPTPTLSHRVNSTSVNSVGYGSYGQNVYIDYLVNMNSVKAYNTEITANVNTASSNVFYDSTLIVKKELIENADNIKIKVIYLDNKSEVIDLDYTKIEDQEFNIGDNVKQILISTDEFISSGNLNYIRVNSKLKNQKISRHSFSTAIRVFDSSVEDSDMRHSIGARIDISLPVPSLSIRTNGNSSTGTVGFDKDAYIDFAFGTNNIETAFSQLNINLNTASVNGFHDASITVKKELANYTDKATLIVKYINGTEKEVEVVLDKDSDFVYVAGDNVMSIILVTDTFKTNQAQSLVRVNGRVNRQKVNNHTFNASYQTIESNPTTSEIVNASGRLNISMPAMLSPNLNVTTIYGGRNTSNSDTIIGYESTFEMNFQVNTGNVSSPESSYTIELLKSSDKGQLNVKNIKISEQLLANAKYAEIILHYQDGTSKTTHLTSLSNEISNDDNLLDNLQSIEIKTEDLNYASMDDIANITFYSTNIPGSNQTVKATFNGTQNPPYTTASDVKTVSKQGRLIVYNSSTSVSLKGVSQVDKKIGSGSSYTSVVPYRINTSRYDYTSDQGYKSLGGYTVSLNRTNQIYANNNQIFTIDLDLPEHIFDLYYIKIREELKSYIKDINIYRNNGEVESLWQEINGKDWVYNTEEEKYWRINTAGVNNSRDELYKTYDSKLIDSHAYYKNPFNEDVKPENPVSRVEVILQFEKGAENTLPSLPGATNDVIEYMGRFYESSKVKDEVVVTTNDVIGLEDKFVYDRSSNIYTIVNTPYARTYTGAHDSTTLPRKELIMGTIGEYKSSIWNETEYVNYAHGPDVYTPVATEYDQWLYRKYVESFHDELTHEFVFPNSPNDNKAFNYDSKYYKISSGSVLKYLDSVIVTLENKEEVAVPLSENIADGVMINFVSGPIGNVEVLDNGEINIGIGSDDNYVYPKTIVSTLKNIPGFGDKTSEIDGVNPDKLGSSINEVDFTVGGIINGDNAQIGTSNTYRDYSTSSKRLLKSSSASLIGKTPELSGRFNMQFDKVKVYDYKVDGITPTDSTVLVDFENIGQADIKQVDFDFTPDKNFRTKQIEIPSEIFNGELWNIDSITIRDGSSTKRVDVKEYFKLENGMYILDVEELFDSGVLGRSTITNDDIVLNKDDLLNIQFSVKPLDENTVLYGSFTKEERQDDTLPSKLTEETNLIVKGIWVDEEENGSTWNSKPSFVNYSTKSSNEISTVGSLFNIKGKVYSYLEIYKSAGTGNLGENPTLSRSGSAAPRLFNRVAQTELSAKHLNNDLTLSENNDLFYDKESNKQVKSNNINVGDTTKVLYKYTNTGTKAESDITAGNIPLFNPKFIFEVPLGLRITSVKPLNANNISENLSTVIDDTKIVDIEDNYILSKNLDRLEVETMINFDESVYILVEYEAVNNVNEDNDFIMQNRSATWYTFAKPENTHHFMSYDVTAKNGNNIVGTTAGIIKENQHYARVYNNTYRFSNPNVLSISSSFDKENVSGEEATIIVGDIQNTLNHGNTKLEIFITLDEVRSKSKTSIDGGFHLIDFPEPKYPEGFKGSLETPNVSFKHDDAWVLVDNFDEDIHEMSQINDLKIDYGIVPDQYDGELWKAEDVEIKGHVYWDNVGTFTTKHYDFNSTARVEYTRQNQNNILDKYTFSTITPKALRVYKAIARVQLNLQSFDTREEALSKYNPSLVGKTSYKPNDDIYYKLALQNINSNQGLNTNTAIGKAPLIEPIIFDKIPEYLNTDISKYYDENTGTIDIKAAVRDEVIIINWYDENDELKTDFKLPNVSGKHVSGLDIGGAQSFDIGVLKNNGDGVLSSAQPNNTNVNPAESINFFTLTYEFEENLERQERIEIVYKATARNNDLPYASYTDGRPVYAPFNGWYGNSNPTTVNKADMTMDMASLLHDIGVTGTRSKEVSATEFLSTSYAVLPGNETKRNLVTQGNNVTFYDSSANKELIHNGFLREVNNNNLYISASSGVVNEYFNFISNIRVNDGKVKSDERILWAQDGIQLSRAWLYGASEFRPTIMRGENPNSNANFYEHDGSLNNINRHVYGHTHNNYDNHTAAVQLNEIFTTRLHGVNMGDRAIDSGLEYVEILPNGISPLASDGSLLGISAFQGLASSGNVIEIDDNLVEFEIIQTPEKDLGYRAPKQSREAQTTGEKTVYENLVPYVIRIRVKQTVNPWFNHGNESSVDEKYQFIDIKVRVEKEIENDRNIGSNADLSVWHDHLTVTTINDEDYLAIYDTNYGKFNRPTSNSYGNQSRYPNNGIGEGLELADTQYGAYRGTQNLSFEPYGIYIRGLNATGNKTQLSDGRLAITGGDQIAMRKPTLRVWSKPEKIDKKDNRYTDGIDDFNVNLYDELNIYGTVENQQLEVMRQYNRTNSGYNYRNVTGRNDDVWRNTPQTIGGAKGSWFEPTMTFKLPVGVVPIMRNGDFARTYNDDSIYQDLEFSATVNKITHESSIANRDVSMYYDAKVSSIETDAGIQYVIQFTLKDDHKSDVVVAYGESLVITPKVKITNKANNKGLYDGIEVYANSTREVFNPIISSQYETGSLPSMTARDNGTVRSLVENKKITEHDRNRLDSMSYWSSSASSRNMGVLGITDRLISKTSKTNNDMMLNGENYNSDKHYGAMGTTTLKLKKPSLFNKSKISNDLSKGFSDHESIDAAGNFWTSTLVENKIISNQNKHIEALSSGDINHSRFLMTYYVHEYIEVLDDYRIKVDGKLHTQEEFEEIGYSVERIEPNKITADKNRNRVQFIVSTPQGKLETGSDFEFIFRSLLVDGLDTSAINDDDTWKDNTFKIDSYVSIITDDRDVNNDILGKDFIEQDYKWVNYSVNVSDSSRGHDINDDGDLGSIYAFDFTTFEILQPKGAIRKNNVKPRELFSNGQAGDAYFNSSETIDYMISYAKNTGSGVKKFIVEDIVPTYETNETSINTSEKDLTVRVSYLTSGKWELPQSMLDKLTRDGKTVDEVFKLSLYVSANDAENGYETLDDWVLVNPKGNSIYDNERFEINDLNLNLGGEIKKIRWVIESLDIQNYLVPNGTRLDVDANPETIEKEEVIDLDPNNQSSSIYPDTVVNNAARIGIRALSDSNITLYIYNNAQLWTNYVDEFYHMLDNSETRSYLTPSRPIVNVIYSSMYFNREDPSVNEYSWTNSQIINYNLSRHLKFKGEFINADMSMWDEDESIIYTEDTLINPHVTFTLPKSVMIKPEDFVYVPVEEIDETSPLSNDFRRSSALTSLLESLWTWRVIDSEGNVDYDHELKVKEAYTGPWKDSPNNVINLSFDGTLDPGYKVVVEFIGEVNEYNPSSSSDEFKSRAAVLNNTGLLKPLNSRQNFGNILGYQLDEYDFNNNNVKNDRVVLAERNLFEYATFENFAKRKTAYSVLNRAGTKDPYATPTPEGSIYSYEVKLENPGATDKLYPVIYDVLPRKNDSEILVDRPRNSNFNGWLIPDSIELSLLGENSRILDESEYDIWVGPFKKVGRRPVYIEDGLPSREEVSKVDFYFDISDEEYRENYFIHLDDIKDSPYYLQFVEAIAITYKDSEFLLPAKHNLVVNYDMEAPLNAPVLFEDENTTVQDISNYANWNTFVAMQRELGQSPQESNRSGVYVTKLSDRVSIGNYIWNDKNYDGIMNEGNYVIDENGRYVNDFDPNGYGEADPGIDNVKVTLKSPLGNDVDLLGNVITEFNGDWYVIDESTYNFVTDEFGNKIVSEGPLITYTKFDINSRSGYYVLSNFTPGNYRVEYEFPSEYEHFGLTSQLNMAKVNLSVFEKSEELPYKERLAENLTVISDEFTIDLNDTDEHSMSFDMGIANTSIIRGNVFSESSATLDGKKDSSEIGIVDYNIYLEDMDGNQAYSVNNKKLHTVTDKEGNYEFKGVPLDHTFRIRVTDNENETSYTNVISPINLFVDPRHESLDNDGFKNHEGDYVTNNFVTDIRSTDQVYGPTDQLIIDTIDLGFHKRDGFGIIGNKVWLDLNKNGVQDEDEPGINDVELLLTQYQIGENDEVTPTGMTRTTVSSNDGFYYFRELPIYNNQANGRSILRSNADGKFGYAVSIVSLPKGYTVTTAKADNNDIFDSDFNSGLITEIDELIMLQDSESVDNSLALNNLNIDLGLVKHGKGSLSGSAWIDNNGDGIIDNEEPITEEQYTFQLQVKNGGEWETVYIDADLDMVNPNAEDRSNHEPYVITGQNYNFENLYLVNIEDEVPYEYRVVVEGISLKYQITEDSNSKVIDDENIEDDNTELVLDNKFEQELRDEKINAISETDVLYDENIETTLGTNALFVNHQVDQFNLGLIPLVTHREISGTIWDDFNKNGKIDRDEQGIEELTLNLYELQADRWVVATDGDLPYTTTSDIDGNYRFVVPVATEETDEIISYLVSIDREENYELSNRDNFSNMLDGELIMEQEIDKYHTVVSTKFELVSEDENARAQYETSVDKVNLDAGFSVYNNTQSIGSFVYNDENNNNIFDENEKGLDGILVNLLKLNLETGNWELQLETVTDADGQYQFDVEAAELDRNHPHYRTANQYRVHVVYGYDMYPNIELEMDVELADHDFYNSDMRNSVTEPIILVSVDENNEIDLNTLVNNMEVDFGLLAYQTEVKISSKVYVSNESNLEDKSNGVEGATVQLQRYNKDLMEWELYRDLNGIDTIITTENGEYEFVVKPTDFDSTSDAFMEEIEYRIVVNKPVSTTYSEHNAMIEEYIEYHEAYTINADVYSRYSHSVMPLDADADAHEVLLFKESLDSIKDEEDISIALDLHELNSKVSGLVFEDKEQTGFDSAKKHTLSNVSVYLFSVNADGNNELVNTTQTDKNGYYEFDVTPFNPLTMEAYKYIVMISDFENATITTEESISIDLYSENADVYSFNKESNENDFGIYFHEEESSVEEDIEQPASPEKDIEKPVSPEKDIEQPVSPEKDIEQPVSPEKDKTVPSGIANDTIMYTMLSFVSAASLFALNVRLRKRRRQGLKK